MKVYAILPSAGANSSDVLHTLQSIQMSGLNTIYVHRRKEDPLLGPDIDSLIWDGETVGSLINKVRENFKADYYIWMPPGVRLVSRGDKLFREAFKQHPDVSLFLSDYQLNDRFIALHPLRDDLTEREDMGIAWGFSGEALDKIGGVDESLKFTTFYDLRLKLSEIAPIFHVTCPVGCPTFELDTPEEEKPDDKAAALFFPGKGAYGGFSYLFMDPEEEKETEEVCYSMLKRRGAWLEERHNKVEPATLDDGDPIVSVVIPVHDRAKFLPMAIDSILKGTLQNFEIIIVDNDSTDNTYEVAQEYAAKDERIRVLKNEVNVIAKALNMGISVARGRYISQLDSDDEYTPRTLEAMTEHLESHPECGLAISYYELMDEAGNTLEDFGIIKHLEYNINNIMRVDGAGAVRTWHRSVIEEMGGFHEDDFPNYGEDYDLVLKVGEKYSVDRVHEVLYRYRRHPGNTDALRLQADKIEAKTLARSRAIKRRQELNRKN